MTATEWNLLDKTELRIQQVGLDGADLNSVAAVVADVLGLPHNDVVVIDARDDLLAIDILRHSVDPYAIAGRQQELLAALAEVSGLTVGPETSLCSQGMLGWIGGNREDAVRALDAAQRLADTITRTIAARALVCSTGSEVVRGQICDTNKPWIVGRLRAAGFTVTEGQNLPDDSAVIADALADACFERGYGIVVTTGGVGAEDKDATVEALLTLDPLAATPALFNVRQGHGRHHKAQVRIGVGQVGTALVVCLPGPHPEATEGTAALLDVVNHTRDKHEVADAIAAVLRERLRRRHAQVHQ
jgi:molybdenum cofactor synthesis domain-containing protein